ncbi:DUF397 domain-containing protein [Streptomyces sp. NPDC052236]|uniref:DUF397 domain-containing protein n=1 Tax=Streptomyces sp. NPDC052236 TaxID=3365686 RepID=UPI0037D4EA0F
MNGQVAGQSTQNLAWFKSSYSAGDGGQCVEVAVTWHKSGYSAGNGGDCVEVASCPDALHVRDSKNTSGPMLTMTPGAWGAFVGYVVERRTA